MFLQLKFSFKIWNPMNLLIILGQGPWKFSLYPPNFSVCTVEASTAFVFFSEKFFSHNYSHGGSRVWYDALFAVSHLNHEYVPLHSKLSDIISHLFHSQCFMMVWRKRTYICTEGIVSLYSARPWATKQRVSWLLSSLLKPPAPPSLVKFFAQTLFSEKKPPNQ